MQRTLEDLVKIPQLKSGQKVNVRLPEDKQFLAQVVGLGSSGILPEKSAQRAILYSRMFRWTIPK